MDRIHSDERSQLSLPLNLKIPDTPPRGEETRRPIGTTQPDYSGKGD